MAKITDCKNISTAINRAKKLLIAKADKQGMYENFGQTEIRLIKDAFETNPYISEQGKVNSFLIQRFERWCMDYTNLT